MNIVTRIVAPAALALFAFGANAAEMISTGGETYAGNPVVQSSAPARTEIAAAGLSTGGETYVGTASNASASFTSPARAGLSDADLERLYIG
ncbi:MAG: hypothetical protein KJZ83_17670 [Burkholderiaceae bacterium]|nr:hypothetical protein [Burkholderiaceae bacterium]